MLVPSAAAALPDWESRGVVAAGLQFAAAADDDSVHIIAQSYVQIDATAAVLRNEAEVSDERQTPLDMYPAIGVGGDGAIHVVTRHGGNFEVGHEIRYTRRAPATGWEPPIVVGQPVPRNYVVGVALPSGGRILVGHGNLVDDSFSRVELYAIEGAAAVPLGVTPQGWLRPDGDIRMASVGNAVLLATSTPGPGAADPTHFAYAANADGDVIAQWQANHVGHVGGAPRRGGPSLYVDDGGNIHLGYGGSASHHYARYTAAGMAAGADVQTHDDLGTYHLGYGNGAVVASPDGLRVAAVALQNSDNDEESADAELVVVESLDGGTTFGAAQPTGFIADGGDGRMRPRLLEVGGTLMLLYRDDAAGGIALATSLWFDEEPEGSTGSQPETTGPGDEGTSGSASDDTSASEGPQSDTGGATQGTTSAGDTANEGSGGLLPPGGTRGDEQGCGCSHPPSDGAPLLGLLGLLGLRRRRSRSSARFFTSQ